MHIWQRGLFANTSSRKGKIPVGTDGLIVNNASPMLYCLTIIGVEAFKPEIPILYF
jgi:hypothetical protein